MHWTEKESAIVKDILKNHIPHEEVHAFGSRVHGKNLKKTSDLDLIIMTKTPLSDTIMMNLKHAFSESDLPFRVDILDWSQTEPYFQEIILKAHQKI